MLPSVIFEAIVDHLKIVHLVRLFRIKEGPRPVIPTFVPKIDVILEIEVLVIGRLSEERIEPISLRCRSDTESRVVNVG